MVRAAVRLREVQHYVAVGVEIHERVVHVGRTAAGSASAGRGWIRVAARESPAAAAALYAAALRDSLEADLAFVIADASRVMLIEGDAEAALEASWRATGNRISLVPANDLLAFFENLDDRIRVVLERP